MDLELAESFSIGPTPDWVNEVDWTMAKAGAPSNGVIYLLSDAQVDATGPEIQSYSRVVSKADSPAGVESIAPVSITFDPMAERVILHKVAVWRDGLCIDRAQRENFEILRRERGLERRVYDGRLTADMILPDVRSGDTVELAYTTIQFHPLTKGMVDSKINLSWSSSCAMTRFILRAQKGRNINMRAFNGAPEPEVHESNGIVTRTWTTLNTSSETFEYYTPPGTIQNQYLQVADAQTWADIANIYRPGYERAELFPADLMDRLNAIKQSCAGEPGAMTIDVMRLVQREVRYLALSMGLGGLVPRQVPEIWESRFGDCKDKSLLLVSCLRHLGVDAAPALVNTYEREGLKKYGPHPYAFDHCIVLVKHDGKSLFIDPTWREQAGTIDSITRPDFGVALPLTPGADLVDFDPFPMRHVSESYEDWEFGPKPSSPAKVQIRTVWRDWKSNQARDALLENGEEKIADDYESWYDRQYSGAKRLEPTKFRDDPIANTLEITETYSIASPYIITADNLASFTLKPEEALPDFAVSRTSDRKFPIDLGLPRRKSRVVRISHAAPTLWQTDAFERKHPAFELSSVWTVEDKKVLRIETNFSCTGGTLPIGQCNDFFTALEESQAESGFIMRKPVKNDEFTDKAYLPNVKKQENLFRWIWGGLVLAYIIGRFLTSQ